jgi:hypothetical protein
MRKNVKTISLSVCVSCKNWKKFRNPILPYQKTYVEKICGAVEGQLKLQNYFMEFNNHLTSESDA